jgi:hypothetical protein
MVNRYLVLHNYLVGNMTLSIMKFSIATLPILTQHNVLISNTKRNVTRQNDVQFNELFATLNITTLITMALSITVSSAIMLCVLILM